MIRLALLPLLALSICACDLKPLMGEKSDAQIWHERNNAPAVATALDVKRDPVAAPSPAPFVAAVALVAAPVVVPAVIAPPQPVCTPVWRVIACDADGNEVEL